MATALALLFLSLTPAMAQGGGEPPPRKAEINWREFMTIAPVKRDAEGKLLPLQPYDETIRRGMSFLLDDHLKWFKGLPESLFDEKGEIQMPWTYYSNLQHSGSHFPRSVDRFVSESGMETSGVASVTGMSASRS